MTFINMAFYLTSVLHVIVLTLLKEVSSTYIDRPPKNTSAVLGYPTIFYCGVVAQTAGQHVYWKKGSDAISFDNSTFDKNKYLIQGTYNLIIRDVQMTDEGPYECDGDSVAVSAKAFLTISVPMENMTLTWGNHDHIPTNTQVNMTCRSLNSRPPAKLRWFKGTREMTSLATRVETVTRPNGYGDSLSVLATMIGGGEGDIPYRCVADLPGQTAIRTEFIFPNLTAASGRKQAWGYCVYLLCFLVLSMAK